MGYSSSLHRKLMMTSDCCFSFVFVLFCFFKGGSGVYIYKAKRRKHRHIYPRDLLCSQQRGKTRNLTSFLFSPLTEMRSDKTSEGACSPMSLTP